MDRTMQVGTLSSIIRQRVILVCLICFAFLMIFRLASFSILKNGFWEQRVNAQISRTIEIEPMRGQIYGRDGNTLIAGSRTQVSIASDNLALRSTNHEVRVANRLAEVFDLPVEQVVSRIYSRQNASWIHRDITPDQLHRLFILLEEGLLPGIHVKREIFRDYPHHPDGASLIGFVRYSREENFECLGPFRNLHGIEGIENFYNDELQGIPGKYEYHVNRFGAPELGSFRELTETRPGMNLVTTIDLEIQRILHDELKAALILNAAASASAIVVEPFTGNILAAESIENTPEHLDPEFRKENAMNCWPSAVRRNLCTVSVFEPGSVWKPVIMSLALEHHLVDPSEEIPWRDPIVCGPKRFYDWKKFPPVLPLADILVYSSNVGIIQVSKRLFNALSPHEIVEEFIRLGFSRRLPIDFPSRPRGILSPDTWGPISVGAVAEGYELGVTVVQLAGFYSIIANGGNRIFPHFGNSLRDPDSGETLRNLSPETGEKVLTDETVQFIQGAMIQCVDHGTGKKANLKEYGILVAGKTATAKLLVNGTYASGKYRASFCGFFPADNPQYVIVVTVEDPTAGSYYGGSVAAPLFRNIARRMAEEIHGYAVLPTEESL